MKLQKRNRPFITFKQTQVLNKINSTLNTNDSKQIKILNFRKSVIGSFSQSSSIFRGLGVRLQCVPNSIISLVYNKYKSCSSWSTQDLDEILKWVTFYIILLVNKLHC